MLSAVQIVEFQKLYKLKFGKKISKKEAYKQGAKLIRLVEITYQPITKNEYEKNKSRKRQTSQ